MKNLKKIFSVFCLIIVVSCSKDDATTPTLDKTVAIASILPTTGTKNTAVVLTGTGFSAIIASNTVSINGKSCAVTGATATQLNIIIPAAAGSGKIKVAVGNANAESSVFDFVFTTTISAFAGSTLGDVNGTGAAAKFNSPFGLTVDALSNVFVADNENHKIRKIKSDKTVTTFVGGVQGDINGTGTTALMNLPFGLASDQAGNVFVADTFNDKIKKITTVGLVTTLAGIGNGDVNGAGTVAKFNAPMGVAVDAGGNIYVADTENNKIKKISVAGVVSTFAGSVAGDALGAALLGAKFLKPNGLAVDNEGNVYVADSGNNKIKKITQGGIVTLVAGSTVGDVNGTGAAAQFNNPYFLTVDANKNVFFTDSNNDKIKKINSSGAVTTLAGSISGDAVGTTTLAKFSQPAGIAMDSAGNLFIADTQNHKIKKITFD
jgi:hypothetical protein